MVTGYRPEAAPVPEPVSRPLFRGHAGHVPEKSKIQNHSIINNNYQVFASNLIVSHVLLLISYYVVFK